MEDISDENYTYDKLFHTRPVGEPWPEQADRRLDALEAQAIADDARIDRIVTLGAQLEGGVGENALRIDGTDSRIDYAVTRIEKLEAHVKHLEAIIHKYINAEEPE